MKSTDYEDIFYSKGQILLKGDKFAAFISPVERAVIEDKMTVYKSTLQSCKIMSQSITNRRAVV